MLWVTLNLPPWDGRYELHAEFTTRELGWIKRHAGYLPLTINDGVVGGDAELFGVLAAIAVRRSGRINDAEVPGLIEQIFDAPYGTVIELEDDEQDANEEDDAGPPAASSTVSSNSSGDGSNVNSETLDSPWPHSGIPGSASSELAPTRSAI